MNAAIGPVPYGFRYKAFFDHGGGIGEMKLKDMPARLDIEADGKHIFEFGGKLIRQDIHILCIQRDPFGEFYPASRAECKYIVCLGFGCHKVAMNNRRRQLKTETFAEFPADNQLPGTRYNKAWRKKNSPGRGRPI